MKSKNGTDERPTCTWRADDDGVYQTECGNAFVLNDGTPKDNRMAYCCYCGKVLLEGRPK